MDEANLAMWLRTTRPGAAMLREVLPYLPAELVAEVMERNRTTYVLVKAYGDGWIEVYAERGVRAKVVELPAPETAEQERLLEDWSNVNLSLPFRAIDYPSNKRAGGYVPPFLGFSEFVDGIVERRLNLSFIEGCKIAEGKA